MKIVVNMDALDAALGTASKIVTLKSTLAVLGHIRFKAVKDRLELYATNLEVEYFSVIGCDVETPGEMTLPAKDLAKMVGKLSARGGDLRIESEENDWASLRAKSFKSRIGGGHTDDFPGMTDTSKMDLKEIDAAAFLRGIRHTMFCAYQGHDRDNLMGVYIQSSEGKTTFAATDGHRLAACDIDVKTPFTNGFTLPSSSAKAVLDTFKGDHFLRVGLNDTVFVAEGTEATVCGRLTEGEFPNFQESIMGYKGLRTTIDRRELVDAVNLVSITASRASYAVRLTFEDSTLNIYGSDPNGNKESSLDIPAGEFAGVAKVGVNFGYLLEALNNLSCDVVDVQVTDTLSPIFIRPVDNPDDIVYVVMPMRL
ncbi:MAG: DNA polymerase III subunit beta [Bradymonadaceae bacterium]